MPVYVPLRGIVDSGTVLQYYHICIHNHTCCVVQKSHYLHHFLIINWQHAQCFKV